MMKLSPQILGTPKEPVRAGGALRVLGDLLDRFGKEYTVEPAVAGIVGDRAHLLGEC